MSTLPTVLADLPAGTTPVVFHSAVLAYLQREQRAAFVDLVQSLPVTWIANEGARVVPGVRERVGTNFDPRAAFVLAVDGEPVARSAPHGQWLEWFTTHP